MWRFLKKLKTELPQDLAIALLDIYPKDINVMFQRGMCTPVFIATMSTIAKLWKEPRYPSTNEWIKKMWYIHIQWSILQPSKNEIFPFATTWMELEDIMLSKISQRKTIICSH